jgi:hypothetical protein
MAIVIALMSMLVMSVLGAALVVTTSTEVGIAANFRSAQQGLYAADAALALAVDELASRPDWNAVLSGALPSAFTDGPPTGVRTLVDGSLVNLDEAVSLLNCAKSSGCLASDLTAVTAARPWGANNPVWSLFIHGALADLLEVARFDSQYYVTVLIGDDPAESDNDPFTDGAGLANAGAGTVVLRSEAYGPRGTRHGIEATVARAGAGVAGVRIISWRLAR